jgi:TIR domain
MKIFISWSGERSLQIAQALHTWLPRVLHAAKPYLSVEDTAKGAYWVSEVKHQLDTASFGIICLTPDNLHAPWINFEAGALSKSFERGSVAPFLFGVSQDALTGPLTQFQVTEASKPNDVLRLVKDLDAASGERAVGARMAEDSFHVWWPYLENDLQLINAPRVIGQRPVDDMVREILDRQRTLERVLSDSLGPISSQYMEALLRQAANIPGPDLRVELEDALKELSQALDACGDSDDPAVKQVVVHATAVRALLEKMTAGNRLKWEPLRKRDQRGLTAGGA